MNQYRVQVIREAGVNPISKATTPRAEEVLTIYANTIKDAYRQSFSQCTLAFMGQDRRTIIDGEEYLSPTR